MPEWDFSENFDFDNLYKTKTNPWGQDGSSIREKEYYNKSRKILRGFVDSGSYVAEIGSGLGYSTNAIGANIGFDISAEAVRKAKKNFPSLAFKVADIRKEVVSADIIILNELLWYILPKLQESLDNCDCDFLVVSQAFPQEQRWGKDIIDGFGGLFKFLKERYPITKAIYTDFGELNHGVISCIKQSI